MGFKLTDVEFAYKVDSEGGIFGALLGYGLTAEDLVNVDGRLAKAVSRLDEQRANLRDIIVEIDDAIDEALGEE